MKVALVNVKYSPNLGDGLIAECLEWALARHMPGATFVPVDLAGRTDFSPSAGAGRGRALALLARLPAPLRQMAASAVLRTLIATRYTPTWTERLEGCERLVLGGGQLMADADLNFPHKIAAVSALAAQRNLRAAVFGVGVSGHWSPAGARLFRTAMEHLAPVYVAVRDEASRESWDRHFSQTGTRTAKLCRDPGLIAAEVYGCPDRPTRARPLAGIGVVHPLTLNLHSSGAPLSAAQATEAWTGLIQAALAQGLDVALFTNGPADDEAFLDAILAQLPPAEAAHVQRPAKPNRPADLVRSIGGCDVIAAHRLHANIVAWSCGVPHVGLGWDAKLPAFFDSVGRAPFVAGRIEQTPPGDLAALLLRAIDKPMDETQRARIVAETLEGIRACAEALA